MTKQNKWGRYKRGKGSSTGSNKKIRNATHVSIDGIDLRSGLEGFTYQRLKENGLHFTYEKHIFILQDGFVFSGSSLESKNLKKDNLTRKVMKEFKDTKVLPITYKPDFVHLNPDTKEGWIIETKGFRKPDFDLKWKMFKYYLVKNNYKIRLFMPSNHPEVIEVINKLKQL